MDDPGASSSAHPPDMFDDDLEYIDNLECTTIEESIAFNETYKEMIDNAIVEIEAKLLDNQQKQKALKEEQRRVTSAEAGKKKVPVNLYMPPYFKDENGMCPPMSSEARAKLDKKWFDPLMKEEKKWTPAELKLLKEGIKDSIIANELAPLCSKRDILTSKLRNIDVNTTQLERTQWTLELERIMRDIEYCRGRKEEDVLKPSTNYDNVRWNEVANVNLKGTRTEWAVRAKWMNEMHPKWNHGKWENEEIEKLISLRENERFISWPILAMKLGTNRTPYQCFEKYKSTVAQHSKEWGHDEDQKLITLTNLLTINGAVQWDKVAQFMPGRTRQQVRTRYSHTLDTSLKHGRWTDQEDLLLICAVSRLNAKDWAKIAQAVPGRNDSQCRERWCNVLNRPANITDRFTLAEDEQLLYAVKLFGKGSWAKCATFLPRKTSKQLRRRYIQLIAAKIKMISGYCSAVSAMETGRRAPEEVDNDVEAIEEFTANDIMKTAFKKYSELSDCQDETPEEMIKRVNEANVLSKRYHKFKNSPDWPTIEKHVKDIMKQHNNGENEEIRSNEVLRMLNISDVDVRYMISKSKTSARSYKARRYTQNVDRQGSRIRPISKSIEQDMDLDFDKDVPEEDRQMTLVEALCTTVRQVDSTDWGKAYWRKHQYEAAKLANNFVFEMLTLKSEKVANCRLKGEPFPAKTTLAPTLPTLNLLTVLQRARKGLNQLSSKHFYPLEISNEEHAIYTQERREDIDEKTCMNIKLSENITESYQYAYFQAQMRALLLEPCRLKYAIESAEEESLRLNQEVMVQQRDVEEECVQEGTLPISKDPEYEKEDPESIKKILKNGINIDVNGIVSSNDKIFERKRKIENTMNEVIEKSVNMAKRRRDDNEAETPDVNDEVITFTDEEIEDESFVDSDESQK